MPAMINSVSFCNSVNEARTCAGNCTQITVQSEISITARTVATTRTPRGRNLTGRSEAAGMDVGGEDAAGADVVEVVHHVLRAGPRQHRADRDPALPVQRG